MKTDNPPATTSLQLISEMATALQAGLPVIDDANEEASFQADMSQRASIKNGWIAVAASFRTQADHARDLISAAVEFIEASKEARP